VVPAEERSSPTDLTSWSLQRQAGQPVGQ